MPGDAADIVAAFALRGAISLAGADNAELRVAADGADIVSLADDAALVGAALQNAFELVGPMDDAADALLLVALRIQLVINHHRAGDAADVDVPADRSGIDAAQNLTLAGAVDVLIGGVFDDRLRAVGAGVVHHAEDRVHDLEELVVDAANVQQKLIGGGFRLAVQKLELIGDVL